MDTEDDTPEQRTWLHTGLGLTKEALPFAARAVSGGFRVASWGCDLGFRAGSRCMSVASNSAVGTAIGVGALGAAGVLSLPVVGGVAAGAAAMKVGEVGLHVCHRATLGGIALSEGLVVGALDGAVRVLDEVGVEDGTTARLLFGEDAGRAVRLIVLVASDLRGGAPSDLSWSAQWECIRALSQLQSAAWQTPADTRPQAPHSDDDATADVAWYLRFALASYGHVALKALGVLPVLRGPSTDVAAITVLTAVAEADVLLWERGSATFLPGRTAALHRPRMAAALLRSAS